MAPKLSLAEALSEDDGFGIPREPEPTFAPGDSQARYNLRRPGLNRASPRPSGGVGGQCVVRPLGGDPTLPDLLVDIE